MQYRNDKYGEPISILGYGCMRFTKEGGHFDEEKAEREEVAKVTGTNKDDSLAKKPIQRAAQKVYPNDKCPCGSGLKYKQCCGRK